MGNKNTKIVTIDVESQEKVKTQSKITYFFQKKEKEIFSKSSLTEDAIIEELKAIQF